MASNLIAPLQLGVTDVKGLSSMPIWSSKLFESLMDDPMLLEALSFRGRNAMQDTL